MTWPCQDGGYHYCHFGLLGGHRWFMVDSVALQVWDVSWPNSIASEIRDIFIVLEI